MVGCKRPKVEKKKETSEESIVIIHVRNVNGLESSVSGKDDELSDSGHLWM